MNPSKPRSAVAFMNSASSARRLVDPSVSAFAFEGSPASANPSKAVRRLRFILLSLVPIGRVAYFTALGKEIQRSTMGVTRGENCRDFLFQIVALEHP